MRAACVRACVCVREKERKKERKNIFQHVENFSAYYDQITSSNYGNNYVEERLTTFNYAQYVSPRLSTTNYDYFLQYGQLRLSKTNVIVV